MPVEKLSAIEATRRILESLSPELKELLEENPSFRQEVANCLARNSDDHVESIELPRISFNEVVEQLKVRGVDLLKAKENYINQMIRWGIISLEEADSEAAKFDTVTIDTADFKRALQLGDQVRPMFFVNRMTLGEAMNRLIEEPGIGLHGNTDIRQYRLIDIHNPSRYYSQGNPVMGHARLDFVPATRPDRMGLSPKQQLASMCEGMRMMTPMMWFQFFREEVDEVFALQENDESLECENYQQRLREFLINCDLPLLKEFLPDTQTWTQFPNYQNMHGGVLGLGWDLDHRGVHVHDLDPRNVIDRSGARSLLG